MRNDGATALVLSGGGARGAYQAGVLRGRRADAEAAREQIESFFSRKAHPAAAKRAVL